MRELELAKVKRRSDMNVWGKGGGESKRGVEVGREREREKESANTLRLFCFCRKF